MRKAGKSISGKMRGGAKGAVRTTMTPVFGRGKLRGGKARSGGRSR